MPMTVPAIAGPVIGRPFRERYAAISAEDPSRSCMGGDTQANRAKMPTAKLKNAKVLVLLSGDCIWF